MNRKDQTNKVALMAALALAVFSALPIEAAQRGSRLRLPHVNPDNPDNPNFTQLLGIKSNSTIAQQDGDGFAVPNNGTQ